MKFTFLKSEWKYGLFDAPFAVFVEKSFHLLEGIMHTFWELKGQNARNRPIIRKTVFYKEVLDFQSPFKILWFSSTCVISHITLWATWYPGENRWTFPRSGKIPAYVWNFPLIFLSITHYMVYSHAGVLHTFPQWYLFWWHKVSFFVQNHRDRILVSVVASKARWTWIFVSDKLTSSALPWLVVSSKKKSFLIFPSPAVMSLTKLSRGGNNLYITSLFPPRESLVSEKLFLRCKTAI